MKDYRANFVCSICSVTFTRRGSGERHRINNNLGPAAIVRFVDYIFGLVDGRYQPSDPSIHRRKRKDKNNQGNNLFSPENYKEYNRANRFTVLPDMTIDESPSQAVMRRASGLNNNKENRDSVADIPADIAGSKVEGIRNDIESKFQWNRSQETIHQVAPPSYSSPQLERTLKFREFTTLVQKHASGSDANVILTCAKKLCLQSDGDDWINSMLVFLRNYDRNLAGAS